MIRRPPRSTQSRSSAASDVYKRQIVPLIKAGFVDWIVVTGANLYHDMHLSLIHISEPTRLGMISYAVFCLKKKKKKKNKKNRQKTKKTTTQKKKKNKKKK